MINIENPIILYYLEIYRQLHLFVVVACFDNNISQGSVATRLTRGGNGNLDESKHNFVRNHISHKCQNFIVLRQNVTKSCDLTRNDPAI